MLARRPATRRVTVALTGLLAVLLAIAALFATLPAAAKEAPSRLFNAEDLFSLQVASSPQISPDGRTIVYVRRSGDIMTDRMVPALWLIDVVTGKQTRFVAGGGSPRWSPDGSRIAYLANDGDGRQIFVKRVATGETTRVTTLSADPRAPAWSPDGRQIAFIATVAEDAKRFGQVPAKPEGAKWAEPLQVIDRVTYRADGGGYIEAGHDHVFVVPANGGAARQLTFGAYDDVGPLSWRTDSKTILFSAIHGKDADREVSDGNVFAVDVASAVLTQLTMRYGPDANPVFSPDGTRIAWLGFDDRRRAFENNELYVGDSQGRGARPLTRQLDRSIESAQWLGTKLYVSYDDRGQRRLARIEPTGALKVIASNLAGGPLDRPYTGGDFSISGNGVIAYTGGDATSPADIWVVNGRAPRRLTNLNAGLLAGKTLAPVRKLRVTAPDGRAIDAWLATPPGWRRGARLPTILEIHGGPSVAYSGGFGTDMQLYAAHGYAVLWINPRGSASYGAEFANLVDRDFPGKDYDDLMAAVDAAIADGTADPNNLFVTGGSAGGVLTTWIVGKTTRFKAAVAQKPAVNWISEDLTTDEWFGAVQFQFGKLPWEDPMLFWRHSPLSLVGNVQTPTMLLVGSEDYRTPVSEAEQYYAALQVRGVPTLLVKVPGAGHNSLASRPSQSAARVSAILTWFDRYRNGAPSRP